MGIYREYDCDLVGGLMGIYREYDGDLVGGLMGIFSGWFNGD